MKYLYNIVSTLSLSMLLTCPGLADEKEAKDSLSVMGVTLGMSPEATELAFAELNLNLNSRIDAQEAGIPGRVISQDEYFRPAISGDQSSDKVTVIYSRPPVAPASYRLQRVFISDPRKQLLLQDVMASVEAQLGKPDVKMSNARAETVYWYQGPNKTDCLGPVLTSIINSARQEVKSGKEITCAGQIMTMNLLKTTSGGQVIVPRLATELVDIREYALDPSRHKQFVSQMIEDETQSHPDKSSVPHF
ncbi:hypothetical protein G8770_13285 [Aestuariicella hydrocarbonica]|uniref:Uncharacterized protein n=1 Tax=Pseudomaricurvus hydrocarbonicus TaxID=1470433 RepID=A0A9E5MHW9_9GAMM|nr:hypothetical protein [Aestuariicella hydrocarbonica]NHO66516.1 hypothetical protein [Aestuariicella hydrocarbonica]